jgi:NAD(P)-dependent dehydrogenase (short-subunit alcohol dehydrogenase family)
MHRLKLLLIAFAALFLVQPAMAQDAAKRRSVLVTGANSGIGLAITQYLTARGFHVYGGARKDEDLKTLNAMPNVTAVRLDVTKQEDIDAAAKFVKEQGRGLYGVINNAGVAVIGELATVADKDVQWQYEINVMGPLRLNRALIPMLKESKGRTAIIGSLSGFAVGHSGGGYSMTKFAMEAYAETLAIELAPVGVLSGIIDPGSFKSHAREKVVIQQLTGVHDLNQPLTEEQKKVLDGVREAEAKRKEPTDVAEQVYRFLTSDKPYVHYMGAPDQTTVDRVIQVMMDRTMELNVSQPAYTLSRDKIVAMIDDYLAKNPVKK